MSCFQPVLLLTVYLRYQIQFVSPLDVELVDNDDANGYYLNEAPLQRPTKYSIE